MVNILITCPGRAFAMLNILKEEFAQREDSKLIAAANSNIQSALYAADKAYIVPNIHDETYIPRLLEICATDQIKGILTMIDEDLMVLSKAADEFRKIGVYPLLVDFEVAQTCDNKYEMYKFLLQHGFPCATTFSSLEDFKRGYAEKEIDFPVFVKPNIGSGTRGVMKCRIIEEVEKAFSLNPQLLVQEFMDGPEYSLDLYMDTISAKMVSVFAKEKIIKSNTGIGGTATGKSIKDEQLFALTERLAQALGTIGPLNIEIFKVGSQYYVGEVNPRIGGNYLFAHACGIDFGNLIINNLRGIENTVTVGDYEADVLMMRYENLIVKTEAEMIC
jgi:carbamoyl-phosphate synthase large subunit